MDVPIRRNCEFLWGIRKRLVLTITPERLRQNQSHLGTVSAPRPASQLGQKGTFDVPGWERENNTVQCSLLISSSVLGNEI